MNIITVIPLTRSKVGETLSYFTAAEVPVGAIVSVPLRSKSIFGIVMETRAAQDIKSEIKNAPFAIRKLAKVKATAFFPRQFMEAAKQLADYYATTMGAVIRTLISETLLENASTIAPPLPPQASLLVENSFAAMPAVIDETFAIQGDDPDRISSWRSVIRQEFARKKSIAVYVPTVDEAKRLYASLEKGIEGYIFVLYGSLTEKKLLETWQAIAEMDHPVVVIATGTFSLLPRGDIDIVVIERENGRGWIGQKSPYLDLRHAIETIARKRKQTVFLADALLRLETLERLERHEIDQGSPFKWRSISTATDMLVDMKSGAVRTNEARGTELEAREHELAHFDGDLSTSSELRAAKPPKFRVFSPELEELIVKNREESMHLFMMCVRRGMSPTTVCGDCETIVACQNCSAPVVLHSSPDGSRNFFMCHVCGERRKADVTCLNCGSWRLVALGIGIDRIAEELALRYPETEVFKIDADTTKTEKQIAETLEKFHSKPGSILLGTEMALAHLTEAVHHVAVVSLDSLFALPDFRIGEKIMYTLIRLRSLASRSILVQTRRADESVFEYGLKGNLAEWTRALKAERKQFNYPPYTILVKITIEGKKDKIAEEMADIQKMVTPYEIDIFPAYTGASRGNSQIHGLMKIETNRWPDPDLAAKLRALPPHVSVKVNPESLL